MKLYLRTSLIAAIVAAFWIALAGTSHAAGEESCFTSKLNGARTSSGLPPLTTRSDLVSIARRHSSRMASSGSIYHNSNLPNEAPNDWQSLGENVGMGPECGEIHTAFMNSPSHRKNILDRSYNYVGVGVVVAGDGTIYVTEVFMQAPAATTSGGSTAAAPPPVRRTTPTTRPVTRRPAAQAPQAPAPSPTPPPPPPGSKVTGATAGYLDLLEIEPEVSQSEIDAHRRARLADIAQREQQRKQRVLEGRARPSVMARISSFLGGMLSGSI